jgi:hypothetical protein
VLGKHCGEVKGKSESALFRHLGEEFSDLKNKSRIFFREHLKDGSVHLLRTLLDSGTSATMLLRKHVEPGMISKYEGNPVKWTTLGGVYTTKRKALMEFRLPESSLNKSITWSCHVDETTDPKFAQYDMIIGDNLMQELCIDLLYSKHLMVWEDNEVPMKNRGLLKDTNVAQHIYRMHVEDSPGPPGTASTNMPAMPKHTGMTFRHALIIDPKMTGVREI